MPIVLLPRAGHACKAMHTMRPSWYMLCCMRTLVGVFFCVCPHLAHDLLLHQSCAQCFIWYQALPGPCTVAAGILGGLGAAGVKTVVDPAGKTCHHVLTPFWKS